MKEKITLPSNTKFGVFFSIIFLFLGWYFYSEKTIFLCYFLIFLSGIFLIITIFNSKILLPLNKLWMKFGLFLGSIIAPLVMGIVYFMVVTPVGLIMRSLGKDLLRIKKNKSASTYWIAREKQNDTMKRQF